MAHMQRTHDGTMRQATPEDIPDDVLERAISMTVNYGECPHCGEEQFYNRMAGHNVDVECVECGETVLA